jgi:methyltransferase (TIGR00027 family)
VKARIAGEPAIYPRRVEPGHETIADFVGVRTVYFDRLIARQLPQADQFVMMGAGMDTRAYGALELSGVRVFELDQGNTQQLKRDTLARAGIDASHVTFVTVDFSAEDAFEKLAASEYDPGRKTLFLWEGVTLYLSEKAVRDTLERVKANAAPGSVVVADVYGERMLAMANSRGARQTLEMTGERLNFVLSLVDDWEAELSAFVASTSFTQGETFFLGSESGKGPFMVVVEMVA